MGNDWWLSIVQAGLFIGMVMVISWALRLWNG